MPAAGSWRVADSTGVGGSWLCPQDADRERLLDMEQRLRRVRALTMAILGAALLASGPWVGWWTLIPLAFAVVAFLVAARLVPRVARPEYPLAGAWVASQLAIAGSVAAIGDPEGLAVAWLVIPVLTLPARFTLRGVVAGVALTALLMIAVTVGVDPGAVAAHPDRLLFPLALLAAAALLPTALMESDLHHRTEAVVDPLTGMLNRKALASRLAELRAQAALTGERVGVIVGDVDRFKRVNDEHGHAAGDAVLVDVAYTLRKQLRAFDLVYRLGGEEFLVLLPGADEHAAHEVAERLRCAIRGVDHGGLTVTMSFGVAATAGHDVDFDAVLAAADAALYAAKRGGRDAVALASAPAPAPAPAPALAA